MGDRNYAKTAREFKHVNKLDSKKQFYYANFFARKYINIVFQNNSFSAKQNFFKIYQIVHCNIKKNFSEIKQED